MVPTIIPIGTSSGGVGTSRVFLQATASFGFDDSDLINYALTNGYSSAAVQAINLVTGANTISASNVPALANAGGIFLCPPAGNATAITLKGVTGDTGIVLSKVAPTFISFDLAPPSSFVLTLGNNISNFKVVVV